MIIVLYSLFIKSRQRERKRGTEVSQRSEKVIQGLKKAYTAYFDIEEIDDGTALRARCAYHMRDSQYVLVKKAELWAAECHEYLGYQLQENNDNGYCSFFIMLLNYNEPVTTC